MNFGFTEEQNLLRDQVERFMQDTCPMSKVRELSSRGGFDEALWKQIGELGWLGLLIPDTYGGLGLKCIDQVVVLEAAATGLCPLPIASHALASTAILTCADDAQKVAGYQQWQRRSRLHSGLYDDANWIDPAAITATARDSDEGYVLGGTKPFVSDASNADYLLLAVQRPTASHWLPLVRRR